VASLPAFDSVGVHAAPLADGTAVEDEWMARVAATGSAEAHIWRAGAGLIVPRSYTAAPAWSAAVAASGARGWQVHVRRSGGALVPQGPGLCNLSLIWPSSATPRNTDRVYEDLCGLIARALAQFEIVAVPRAVEGSFCDGRFNLAVQGRKIVGTAQAWRRIEGQPLTLAHAIVLCDADVDALTVVANIFEAALGSQRRYRAETMTTAARAWSHAHDGAAAPTNLESLLIAALTEEIASG
jgi:lipoate-protein ligase A